MKNKKERKEEGVKNREEKGGVEEEAASEGEKETERKGEPGCRGALPVVCVVHAFQPGGSKPGRGRVHTHTYVHTKTYTTIPKGETLLNTKTHYIHTCKTKFKEHTHTYRHTHTHTQFGLCVVFRQAPSAPLCSY